MIDEVFLSIFDISNSVEFLGESLEFFDSLLSVRLIEEILSVARDGFKLRHDVSVKGVALSWEDSFLEAFLHFGL